MSDRTRKTRNGNYPLSYDERVVLRERLARAAAEAEARARYVEAMGDRNRATREEPVHFNRQQAQALFSYFNSKPWSEGTCTVSEQRGDGELWMASHLGEVVVLPLVGGYRVVANALEEPSPMANGDEAVSAPGSGILDLEAGDSNGTDG